ncbi:MAG: DMT family transporter [Leptothrix sp. (in: b-proteobacteria)]
MPRTEAQRRRLGLWLGLAGVLMFAMTLPLTRVAVGPTDAPQLPPGLVVAGRAAVAGLLSALYLRWAGAPRPTRSQWTELALGGAGVAFGFPFFLGWAVREVEAVHAAVITGLLPLATAVIAALRLKQRPSLGFWLCALAGCALVVCYAVLQGGGRLSAADGLLLLAVLSASFGYVSGARLSAQGMAPQQVICWMLVLCLPVTLPVSAWQVLEHRDALPLVSAAAWLAFVYLALVSMWLGFFAWYRGLDLGGTLRVSQVQLIQPFVSMLAAVPLLGERLQGITVAFALAVIVTVLLGKRMSVQRG